METTLRAKKSTLKTLTGKVSESLSKGLVSDRAYALCLANKLLTGKINASTRTGYEKVMGDITATLTAIQSLVVFNNKMETVVDTTDKLQALMQENRYKCIIRYAIERGISRGKNNVRKAELIGTSTIECADKYFQLYDELLGLLDK